MRIISGSARGTKLYTLEGIDTRPTLDRIKENLFNIINSKIKDAFVLDLFAGSGALGLECASRGAKKVILCDIAKPSINILNKNIEKTNLKMKVEIIQGDSIKILDSLTKYKFNLIFLDPPYKTKLVFKSVEKIIKQDMLTEDGIIVIETDEEERILSETKEYEKNIYDIRKYGRVKLLFMRKG